MSPRAKDLSTASPAAQLAGFIDKYDPAVGKLARPARAAMRKRLPTALELVYDNYQFLAIGYSATERASDCIVSLAVSPKGVALSFYYGASIPDPAGVLLGSGNQNRFVRLESAATLTARRWPPSHLGCRAGPDSPAGRRQEPHDHQVHLREAAPAPVESPGRWHPSLRPSPSSSPGNGSPWRASPAPAIGRRTRSSGGSARPVTRRFP